jgi:AbrB family looped-hinge helix DNA binding protein
MAKRSEKCFPTSDSEGLSVESIVSIDERGQMVLPKEVRDKFSLRPGDKLALVTKQRNGKVCCIYLFKAEELMESAKEKLGPLLSEPTSS